MGLTETLTPKVSCRITAAILQFAAAHGLRAAALCDGLPATPELLADSRGWVGWPVSRTLWERLAQATGNHDVAADVGLSIFKTNLLGGVGTIFALFGSMRRALQRTEMLTRYLANCYEIKPVRVGAGSALLELTTYDRCVCWHDINFLRGFLAGLPTLWRASAARVVILRCALSPADCSPIDGRLFEVRSDGAVVSAAADDAGDRREEGRLAADGSFRIGDVVYGGGNTSFHLTWEKAPPRWLPWTGNQDALAGTVANLEKDLREIEALYAQLHDASAGLQQTVSERTTELERANRELVDLAGQLERRSRVRSEFLADLSHELRTSITSIAGFADLLSSEIYGALNRRQRDASERISLNARVLLRVINDLLDLSQLQAGKMTVVLEPVGVRETLDEALATVAPLAAEKNLELRLEIDPETPVRFTTDAVKLKNVLLNLLANAVKFSDRGRVTLRASSRDPSTISFAVEDAGGGFSADELATLFEDFARVGRAAPHATQVGLGMNITKKLVDLLRGAIDVANQPGLGAVFTVTLPTQPPADALPGPEETPGWLDASRSRHTVLVAESSLEEAHLLRLSIEAEGLRADVCDDGRTVLRALAESGADLLVIDPLMQRQDGWQTLRELRATPRFAALPVLIVSENPHAELAQAFNVARTFAKPYDVREIVREVLQRLQLAPAPADAP